MLATWTAATARACWSRRRSWPASATTSTPRAAAGFNIQAADCATVPSGVGSSLTAAAPRRRAAAVEKHRPDVIVPEIEAIDTATRAALEGEGWRVAPSAKAVQLTMNRDRIRDFEANQLGLVTSKYRFAESRDEAIAAAAEVGLPCVVKPVMW